MNKELIKKYPEEFNHFLNDGKIIYRRENKEWLNPHPDIAFNWSYTADIMDIIINDEYVEYRKALADGEIIQQLVEGEYRDVDFCGVISFNREFKYYRVKPEPTFKVGDWVRHPDAYTFKADEHFIFDCEGSVDLKGFELWEPQVGEWCWFWDPNNKDVPILSRFKEMDETDFRYRCTHSLGQYYFNCAPFLGKLPSWCKEK